MALVRALHKDFQRDGTRYMSTLFAHATIDTLTFAGKRAPTRILAGA